MIYNTTLRSRTTKNLDNEKKRLTSTQKTVNENFFDNFTKVQLAKENSIFLKKRRTNGIR